MSRTETAQWRPAADKTPVSPGWQPNWYPSPASRANAASRRLFRKPPHFDSRILNTSQAPGRIACRASCRLVKRLVQHDGHRHLAADVGQPTDLFVRHGLLDATYLVREQRPQPGRDLVRCQARWRPAAGRRAARSNAGSSAGDRHCPRGRTDLDLALGKAIEPHFQRPAFPTAGLRRLWSRNSGRGACDARTRGRPKGASRPERLSKEPAEGVKDAQLDGARSAFRNSGAGPRAADGAGSARTGRARRPMRCNPRRTGWQAPWRQAGRMHHRLSRP